jgi:hypothetical protein
MTAQLENLSGFTRAPLAPRNRLTAVTWAGLYAGVNRSPGIAEES